VVEPRVVVPNTVPKRKDSRKGGKKKVQAEEERRGPRHPVKRVSQQKSGDRLERSKVQPTLSAQRLGEERCASK